MKWLVWLFEAADPLLHSQILNFFHLPNCSDLLDLHFLPKISWISILCLFSQRPAALPNKSMQICNSVCFPLSQLYDIIIHCDHWKSQKKTQHFSLSIGITKPWQQQTQRQYPIYKSDNILNTQSAANRTWIFPDIHIFKYVQIFLYLDHLSGKSVCLPTRIKKKVIPSNHLFKSQWLLVWRNLRNFCIFI